ncbi:MAG: nuclear transport factor 2 family protein [Pseudomonadota bacterium]
MPTRQRVREFIDAVVHGNHAEVIAKFYDEQASLQENRELPVVGRDKLVQREQASLDRLSEMTTCEPDFVLIDEDSVVIEWTFDATDKKGITRRLNEISLQTWCDERITSERFVYDTASAWQIVASASSAEG